MRSGRGASNDETIPSHVILRPEGTAGGADLRRDDVPAAARRPLLVIPSEAERRQPRSAVEGSPHERATLLSRGPLMSVPWKPLVLGNLARTSGDPSTPAARSGLRSG